MQLPHPSCTDLYCTCRRSQMKDYWDISSQAFPSVSRHADAHSAGLLESLRLSADIKGFFKPLTATAKTASGSLAVLNPMVGCQVTLEGIGVQWASAQVFVQPWHESFTCCFCLLLHGLAVHKMHGLPFQQCHDCCCASACGSTFSVQPLAQHSMSLAANRCFVLFNCAGD